MDRITLKRVIGISSLLVVGVIILILAYLQRPHADEINSEVSGSGVVWGRITDSTNKPLADIIVTIGSKSGVTGQSGGYIITTDEIGRLPIQLKKKQTMEVFSIRSDDEQAVFIKPGQSQAYNISVEKLVEQPSLLKVQAETATTSPPTAAFVPSTQPTIAATSAPKPAQPTNLTASVKTGPSRIELKWTDNALGEGGYSVVRTEDKTALVKIFDLPANTTTYSDTSVSKGKAYFYKVRAFNHSGNTKTSSPLSNEKKVTAK